MIYYDNQFNANEIFIIVLLLFYIPILLLPRRFPLSIVLVFILYGGAIGRFWDQIIGTPSMDFYDINDSNKIELFDLLLYWSYGSFSYFMVYIFDKLKFKKEHVILYILAWSLISMGFEWLGDKFGVFHYKNGYKLIFSFPIYLIIYSILFIIYYKIRRRGRLST